MIQAQWFPTKIIDLGANAIIEKVSLSRLPLSDGKSTLFSVLLSTDGRNWFCAYTQSSHNAVISDPYQINFPKPFLARFVKLRLDGYGDLKSSYVEVHGQRSSDEKFSNVENILNSSTQIMVKSKIVIATLFNESDDFLMIYLDNFIAFTPDNVFLIVNFPNGRIIPPQAQLLSPRIFIINGKFQREKWGETLLLGHLESLQYAEDNLKPYNYFCVMASNSLFFRPLNLAAALCQLHLNLSVPVGCERSYDNDIAIDPENTPHNGTWMWQHYRAVPALSDYLKNDMALNSLYVAQIEGLFTTRENWVNVLQKKNEINNLSQYHDMRLFMALEELLPVSIFKQYGSGQFTNICHVLWKGARVVSTDDLILMAPYLPDHISALKWFDRNIKSSATLAVGTAWGRELLGTASSPSNFSKSDSFLILSDLQRSVFKSLQPTAFTQEWWLNSDDKTEVALRWASSTYFVARQRFDLPMQENIKTQNRIPAHFFFEDTHHTIDLSVFLTQEDEQSSILKYFCSSSDIAGNVIKNQILESYLYISPLVVKNALRVRVRADDFFEELTEIVFFYNDTYARKKYNTMEKSREYTDIYFEFPRGIVSYVGLPIISNKSVSLWLSCFDDL